MEDTDRLDQDSRGLAGQPRKGRAAVVSLLAGVVAIAVTVGVMAMLALGLFTSPFGLALATGAAVTVGIVVAAICYLVMSVSR